MTKLLKARRIFDYTKTITIMKTLENKNKVDAKEIFSDYLKLMTVKDIAEKYGIAENEANSLINKGRALSGNPYYKEAK